MKTTESLSGYYSPSGKLLFESPPEKAISELVRASSKITYFSYHLAGDNLPPINESPDSFYFIANTQGLARNLYNWDIVIPRLEAYLARKYRHLTIHLRGIACSIDTNQPFKLLHQTILNPIEIIQRGGEGTYTTPGKNRLPAAYAFDPSHPEIGPKVLQWLLQWPEELRQRAAAQGQAHLTRNIFPLLLVYDRQSVLTHPDQPSTWITEALILDYPLSRQEYADQDD